MASSHRTHYTNLIWMWSEHGSLWPSHVFWGMGGAGISTQTVKKCYVLQRRPEPPTLGQDPVAPLSYELVPSGRVQPVPRYADFWALKQLCHWPPVPRSCLDWAWVYWPISISGTCSVYKGPHRTQLIRTYKIRCYLPYSFHTEVCNVCIVYWALELVLICPGRFHVCTLGLTFEWRYMPIDFNLICVEVMSSVFTYKTSNILIDICSGIQSAIVQNALSMSDRWKVMSKSNLYLLKDIASAAAE